MFQFPSVSIEQKIEVEQLENEICSVPKLS